MLRLRTMIAAAALAACSPPPQAPSSAPPAPEAGVKMPAPATDAWIGRWPGVEGNYLDIAAGAAPGVYAITEGTLDGVKTHVGAAQDRTIVFEENGVRKTIRAGAGGDTGLKWLADKTDCLVIESGRGFCR
ncbi:MAG: hypothetical protein AB7G04_08335 [Hyphomonadaceae bacterium]